jgi:uncharacterized protein YuzB (UPF0349 family)
VGVEPVKVSYCCYNASPEERRAWREIPGVTVVENLCMANCSDCRIVAYAYVNGACRYGATHADLQQEIALRKSPPLS